jgi:hypothetical protein
VRNEGQFARNISFALGKIKMRKVVKPKIIYKYVGDESPEKKQEAEKIMEKFYFSLFDEAAKRLREKKKSKKDK